MSTTKDHKRGRRAILLSALVAVAICSPSTVDAGFLDQLFGAPSQVQTPQASAVTDAAFPAQSRAPKTDLQRRRHSAKADVLGRTKQDRVVVAKVANLQHPRSLTTDRTLRPGDAIMQSDGLKIYLGPVAGKRDAQAFVPLQVARNISPTIRAKLVAILPAQTTSASPTPTFGRSSTTGLPVRGLEIADRRYGMVRYVGP